MSIVICVEMKESLLCYKEKLRTQVRDSLGK